MKKLRSSLIVIIILGSLLTTTVVHSEDGATHPTPPPTPTYDPVNHPVTTPPAPNIPAPTPFNSPSSVTTNPVVTPKATASPAPTVTQTTPPATNQAAILSPGAGAMLSGQTKVRISADPDSNIDLTLQPTEGKHGSIFLSRVKSDSNSYEYLWDTPNTPNGTYQLYATVLKSNQITLSLGSVRLSVANNPLTAPPHTSSLPPNTALPQSSSRPTTTNNNPPINKQETKTVPISSIKDITFSSEFNPAMIQSSPQVVIEKVENTKQKNETVLTLKGKATPNQVITILIFSNPIVVTVKTDANGVWTYNLDKPLSPGEHVAYAVVPQQNGSKVRSEMTQFFISPAFAASSNNESLVLASAPENPAGQNLMLLTLAVILGGVSALVLIYRRRRKVSTVTASTKDHDSA